MHGVYAKLRTSNSPRLKRTPPLTETLSLFSRRLVGVFSLPAFVLALVRRLCIYAAAPLGETLHENYQVSCNTYLFCFEEILGKYILLQFVITRLYSLESVYSALCMFVRVGAEGGEAGYVQGLTHRDN